MDVPPAVAAPEAAELSRYLERVARRGLWFKTARAVSVATAVLSTCLALSALLSGPAVGALGAVLVWSALLSCVIVLGGIALGDLAPLRGPRRARLLRGHDPELAARAQSAAELLEHGNGSRALIAAYSHQVARELAQLPLSQAAPAPTYFRPTLVVAWIVTTLCGALLVFHGSALSGLYALTHPAGADDDGTPVGLWIAKVEVHITAPTHLGLAARSVVDPSRLEVPAGSRIDLSIEPRLAVERAVLGLASRTLPMTLGADGKRTLSFTASESAPLALRALIGGRWIADRATRELVVIADGAPAVALDAPIADVDAEPSEPIPFVFRASDDHGLGSVDLVVQNGRGRERRIHLQGFERDGTLRHEGSTYVTPSDFGARPGVSLSVWIEARDRDRFDGPHVGRSPLRTLRVGGGAARDGAPIRLLTRTRDQTTDTLAARLEAEPAAKLGEAKLRTERLRRKTRDLAQTLDALADAYRSLSRSDATAGALGDMLRRIQRLDREERDQLKQGDTAKLTHLDGSMVTELEDDLLWLSDLVGRAKLSDASQVLDRLERTRARMHELLADLKSNSDPERRRALLEEIARARGELAELQSRLSEARGDVPGEFVNYDALKAQMEEDPLTDMETALERGDVASAEQALSALERQLAGIENGLRDGESAFAEGRVSPRNRALDEARANIDSLARAQKSLSNETQRVSHSASERASDDSAFRAQAAALAEEAAVLEERARGLGAGGAPSAMTEAKTTAAQRLRDARDALGQGDVHEAQNMAERAADDLGMLASEMSMESRMFPGADGSRNTTAREAGDLARDVARFSRNMRDSTGAGQTPQLSSDESAALRKKAEAQRSLGEQADRVAREAEQGAGRSVSDGLGRARSAMQQAAQAMEHGEAGSAQAHQRDALDRLEELSDELNREQRAGGQRGRPDQGETQGQGDGSMGEERVAIPEGDADTQRRDLRRRVLDARRSKAPSSFAGSVERYYQELLR